MYLHESSLKLLSVWWYIICNYEPFIKQVSYWLTLEYYSICYLDRVCYKKVWWFFIQCPFICPSFPLYISQSVNYKSVYPFIHPSACPSVSQSDRHAGSYFAYIVISVVLLHCMSVLTRFYQLLAVYIFFLICFSIAILLRPLEVSCIIFVSHGEKWVHLFWCSCIYNVDVMPFFTQTFIQSFLLIVQLSEVVVIYKSSFRVSTFLNIHIV